MNLINTKLSIAAIAAIFAGIIAFPQAAQAQTTAEVAPAPKDAPAAQAASGTAPVDIENMNLKVVGQEGSAKPVNVQQEVNQEEVIAKVGNTEIKIKDITAKLESLPPWIPRDAIKRDEKLKILDRLVKEVMIDLEIKEKKFEDDAKVKDVIAEIVKKIEFQNFIENEIKNNIKEPSEADIKDFYDKNAARMNGAPLEQAKPQIVQFLKNQKAEDYFNPFLKKLCADYELKTDEAAIQKIKTLDKLEEKDLSTEIFKMKGGGVTLGDVKKLVNVDKIMNPGKPMANFQDDKVLGVIVDNILKSAILTKAAVEAGFTAEKNPKVAEDIKRFKETQLKRLYMEIGLEYKNNFTDEEKKNFFGEHKEEFGEAEKVRASHILVDSEEKAKEIEKKLAEGAKFEEMAKAESKCPSKEKGGDLDFFGRGQMIKEFEDAAFGAEIGKILPPVKTKFGYHIIKVTEKKAAKVPEYKEVEEKVVEKLKNSEKTATVKKFEEELAKKYKYEIYPDKIK